MADVQKGVLTNIVLAEENGGWRNYTAAFNGSSIKFGIPPDGKHVPKNGDTVELYTTSKGTYVLKGKKSGGGGGGGKGGNYRSSKRQTPSDYETQIRDPKIEFQFYFNKSVDAAIAAVAAGLPLTGKGKAKVKNADEILGYGWTMADRMFNQANPKVEPAAPTPAPAAEATTPPPATEETSTDEIDDDLPF